MKLQYGKQYTTRGGHTTAPLVLNNKRAINYPFKDPATGKEYSETGEPWNGSYDDFITSSQYTIEEKIERDYDSIKEENKMMRAYIKDVVIRIQELRLVHTDCWNELPQSVKDYIAQ